MRLLVKSRSDLESVIDDGYSPEESIVLRYINAFILGKNPSEDRDLKGWLRRTSIREGARISHLLRYRGVDVHILDETSLCSCCLQV